MKKSAFLGKMGYMGLMKALGLTSLVVPTTAVGAKVVKDTYDGWNKPGLVRAVTDPSGFTLDVASQNIPEKDKKRWKDTQIKGLQKGIESATEMGSEVADLKEKVVGYKDILPSPTTAKALMYGVPIAAGGTYLAGKYLSRPQETNTINNIASSPVLASLIGAAGGALGGGALSKNFVVKKKGESDEDYEKRKRIRMILGSLIGGGALGTAGYFAGKQR